MTLCTTAKGLKKQTLWGAFMVLLLLCFPLFMSCDDKDGTPNDGITIIDDGSADQTDDNDEAGDENVSDDDSSGGTDDTSGDSEAPLDLSGVTGYDQDPASLDTWDLIFEDEFESDLSNWIVWEAGAFNNELQHYQEDNLILEDGYLFIRGRRQNVTGDTTPFDSTQKNFNFTSGRIESAASYSAGNTEGATKLRISARILLSEGAGLWPAFWTYGDPWPTQGEIDIMEFRGSDTDSYVTNFFYGTASGQIVTNPSNTTQNIFYNGNLTENWHVFELIWSEDTFEIFLDGALKYTYSENEWDYMNDIYGKSQRVILNMALGGNFFQPNVNPDDIPDLSFTVVDWVRVYKQ